MFKLIPILVLFFAISSFASDRPIFLWIKEGQRAFKAQQVISNDEIEKNSFDLVKSFSEQPGLMVLSQGGFGQVQSVFIQGAKSEHVLVLLDGQPINDPTSPSGGFDFSTIDPAVIDSIDIWKGSQGVRWGPKALAGVIEIRTKKPHSPVGASGKLMMTDQGSHLQNLSGWGVVTPEMKALLSVGHQASQKPSGAAREDGNSENDRANRWSVFGSTWWETLEQSVQASVFSVQGQTEYDQYGGPGGDDPNAKASRSMRIPRFSWTRIWSDQLRSEMSLGWMLWRRYENDEPDNQHTSFLQSESLAESPEFSQRWVHEKQDQVLEWGMTFGQERARFTTNSSFGSDRIERKHAFGGVYLRPEWRWDQHVFSVGGRYQCEERQSCFPFYEIRLKNDQEISVNWSKGQRTATGYQLYSSYGNENLQTEEVSSFEITKEFSEAQGTYFMTAFLRDYSDLIDYEFSSNRYENVDEATVRGGELGFRWVQETLFYRGSITFQEARDQIERETLLRRPQWLGHFGVLYVYGQEQADVGVSWMGKRPDVNNLGDRIWLGDVFSLDFSYQRQLSSIWKIHFEVKNLLDQKTQAIWGYTREGRVLFLGSSFLF